MKHFHLVICFFLVSMAIQAQEPFITTWEVPNGDLEITIPSYIGSYNYSVDFGDGNVINNITGDYTHQYPVEGIYTVSISGQFPSIRMLNSTFNNRAKLKSIEQWGDIQWESMSSAFAECEALVVNAIDAPDLSEVTTMHAMFRGAVNFNQSIDHWNVSNVEFMSSMFKDAFSFNQPLNSWDVSNVYSMEYMFSKEWGNGNPQEMTFNQAIDNWDTSNVAFMDGMFSYNIAFNQPLDSWDVSDVDTMEEMFISAVSFNQPLNSWDVSDVSNMRYMFYNADAFNQPLDNWVTSSLNNTSFMFGDCSSFNGAISTWDMTNVTNLSYMFYKAEAFNQPLNSWNPSMATGMTAVFQEAPVFNQPIDSWDVSNVESMNSMFKGASAFNQSLNSWDVSNVESMKSMFAFASSFNGTIGNWNTQSVENTSLMFEDAIAFNQQINNWNVSNVAVMSNMFNGAISFNQPIDSWDVSSVYNMLGLFSGAISFNQSLNSWDTSGATNMNLMFEGATAFNSDINDWNVSYVSTMVRMFEGASTFNKPLFSWDVSEVDNVRSMFSGATSFNQPIDTWDLSEVNNNVISGFDDFLTNTAMSVENMDSFLEVLVNLDFNGYAFDAFGRQYCNQVAVDALVNDMGWSINGIILAPDCYEISGTVLLDTDTNGCDPQDTPTNGFFVGMDNGTTTYSKLITDGVYQTPMAQGTYTVSINNLPEYFDATPSFEIITFPNNPVQQEVDFCLTANQSVDDLNIVLVPLADARPGFEASYKLVAQNVGTEIINNALVSLEFDDQMQNFLEAMPIPSNIAGNTLEFEIMSLSPFQVETIALTFETFTPPIVEGGDVLNFNASISPANNDFTPEDNLYNLEQIVVNSFDPNDKRVLQGEEILLEEADAYLDYIIRFQNTGTANATFVRIKDDLDVDLDWSTIQITSASHNYEVSIANDNEVTFMFNDIDLPYEQIDEEGSKGYIAYKIKPIEEIQIGDVMSGNASIFFDYNPPIITNTTTTTIVEILGIQDTLENDSFNMYPNPTNDILFIETQQDIKNITIYNLTGSVAKRFDSNDLEGRKIDIGSLAEGFYLIEINTDSAKFIDKVVKK